MSEPNLVQQERAIIRTFRQATAQRAKAEAEAEARRKAEGEAADASLNQTKQAAAPQFAQARTALEDVKRTLASTELQSLIPETLPAPSVLQPHASPPQELARAVSMVPQAAAELLDTTQSWIKDQNYTQMLQLTRQRQWHEALNLTEQLRGYRDVEELRKRLIRQTTPLPIGVVLIGLYHFVLGGLSLIIGLSALALYSSRNELENAVVSFVVATVVSAASLAAGYGLWRLNNRGRRLAILLALPLVFYLYPIVIIRYLEQSEIKAAFGVA
ncbi:MAG: hypothetical protein FJ014_17475 [Chloroflexi bacterium]|nr:hypothetical protein [Chloroflexota bacterium]